MKTTIVMIVTMTMAFNLYFQANSGKLKKQEKKKGQVKLLTANGNPLTKPVFYTLLIIFFD